MCSLGRYLPCILEAGPAGYFPCNRNAPIGCHGLEHDLVTVDLLTSKLSISLKLSPPLLSFEAQNPWFLTVGQANGILGLLKDCLG